MTGDCQQVKKFMIRAVISLQNNTIKMMCWTAPMSCADVTGGADGTDDSLHLDVTHMWYIK